MQNLETFLRYFEKVRERTMRVAACIPEEAFERSPIGRGFTFGEILRHLAGLERFMFAENAAGRNSSYPDRDERLVAGREATFAYVDRLHDEAMAIFRSLGDGGMLASCVTPGNAAMPVWKWLRSMVEHEAHHRGQIYTYLSVLGIATPPLFGLTAEEVMARSVEAAS